MEVKDFLYNLTKGLDISTLFENKELRTEVFSLFNNFVDNEYTVLFFFRNSHQSTDHLDMMTYANMIDSEDYKAFRRATYSKLYCYLEIFSKSESLRKIPEIQKF